MRADLVIKRKKSAVMKQKATEQALSLSLSLSLSFAKGNVLIKTEKCTEQGVGIV